MCLNKKSAPVSTISFEPLAPEPQVADKLAKGPKQKSQTQGDEKHGERQDEK